MRLAVLKGGFGRGWGKFCRTLRCKESRPVRRPPFLQMRKSHGLNYRQERDHGR